MNSVNTSFIFRKTNYKQCDAFDRITTKRGFRLPQRANVTVLNLEKFTISEKSGKHWIKSGHDEMTSMSKSGRGGGGKQKPKDDFLDNFFHAMRNFEATLFKRWQREKMIFI